MKIYNYEDLKKDFINQSKQFAKRDLTMEELLAIEERIKEFLKDLKQIKKDN